jgi:hypothetical protein
MLNNFKDWLEIQESIAAGLAALATMGTPHETPPIKPTTAQAAKLPSHLQELAEFVPQINRKFEAFQNVVLATATELQFNQIHTQAPGSLKFVQNREQLAEKLGILKQHFINLEQDIAENKVDPANIAFEANSAEQILNRIEKTLRPNMDQEQMTRTNLSNILTLDNIFKINMQMLK